MMFDSSGVEVALTTWWRWSHREARCTRTGSEANGAARAGHWPRRPYHQERGCTESAARRLDLAAESAEGLL